jgi:hypothetical protein
MKSFLIAATILFSVPHFTAQFAQTTTVTVPNGTFDFTDLRITKCRRAICLKGNLTNNTAVDWGMVEFQLALFDKGGQPLAITGGMGSTLTLFDVKKGTRKVDSELYGSSVKGDIGSFTIAFVSGKYPAVYLFSLTKPSASPALAHEDELMRVSFSIPAEPQDNPISFTLTNKTDNAIVIDWNQVSYVDVKGAAHRVVHKGVRLMERDQPMPATTVPPGSTLEDFIFPSDEIEMLGGKWIQHMLFPDAPLAAGLKGKTFSIFLPLEVNGAKKTYNFVFRIDDIKM